jgi:hypothetical protein
MIIASVLQDSVVRRSELTYLAPSRTFASVFSRYRWEADGAGGSAAIRLATECIDCEISDIGTPWPAARRPAHPIVDEG